MRWRQNHLARIAMISIILLAGEAQGYTTYPKDAIQCYATLSPKGRLICPRDRTNVCIKEEAMMGRGECGTSEIYPHDRWDKKLKQCVYRKCGHQCPEDITVYFNSSNPLRNYTRNIYCCEGDLCNASYGLGRPSTSVLMILALSLTLAT